MLSIINWIVTAVLLFSAFFQSSWSWTAPKMLGSGTRTPVDFDPLNVYIAEDQHQVDQLFLWAFKSYSNYQRVSNKSTVRFIFHSYVTSQVSILKHCRTAPLHQEQSFEAKTEEPWGFGFYTIRHPYTHTHTYAHTHIYIYYIHTYVIYIYIYIDIV